LDEAPSFFKVLSLPVLFLKIYLSLAPCGFWLKDAWFGKDGPEVFTKCCAMAELF